MSNYSKAFDEAFRITIGHEGGYVNDPQDPGGETKYGISKRSYPETDIKSLTLSGAKAIYWRDFWAALGLGAFGDRVAAEIFDTSVNLGRSGAVRCAQRALYYLGRTVSIDGILGPQTREAIATYPDQDELLKELNTQQRIYYEDLVRRNPEMAKYLKGWLKRTEVKEVV